MILFSIILPAYNSASFIRERLDSIFNQYYKNFELIVLDDASADETISVIREYEGREEFRCLVKNDVNSGSPFIQWKKGIEMASGSWIWIAEADDSSDPLFLSRCAEVIEQNESLVLVSAQSNWIDAEGTTWYRDKMNFANGRNRGNIVRRDVFTHENAIRNASAVVFRKDAVSAGSLEKLDQFRWCGDWFLYTEILKGGDLYFIPQHLNYFRRHENASSFKLYVQGYLYKEGLPVSLRIQEEEQLSLTEKMRILVSWSGHLLTQYRKGNGPFFFSPLYYCILMHLLLPIVVLRKLVTKEKDNTF